MLHFNLKDNRTIIDPEHIFPHDMKDLPSFLKKKQKNIHGSPGKVFNFRGLMFGNFFRNMSMQIKLDLLFQIFFS